MQKLSREENVRKVGQSVTQILLKKLRALNVAQNIFCEVSLAKVCEKYCIPCVRFTTGL